MKPRILCFAGSLRKDSFNKKLVKIGMQMAYDAGAEVTYLDLKELSMPVYDADWHAAEGTPETVLKLQKLMKENHGFLISCPEYNSSISGALKNAIDWASRPNPGEGLFECFTGKTAGLLAASPGVLGGLRGLVTVRSIFENINMIVIPEQFALAKADTAFNEDGSLKESKHLDAVKKVALRLVEVTKRLL